MNGEIIGCDWGVIAAVYLALVLFGIGFNHLTALAEIRGYVKGYTALFVVAGVAVTISMTAFIHLVFALVVAGAFIASGTPMIIGSILRYMREREAQIQTLRENAHGDASEEMAP